MLQLKSYTSFFLFLLDKILKIENFNKIVYILLMLNDLSLLIEFDIELKIMGSTIYSKNLLSNYFI